MVTTKLQHDLDNAHLQCVKNKRGKPSYLLLHTISHVRDITLVLSFIKLSPFDCFTLVCKCCSVSDRVATIKPFAFQSRQVGIHIPQCCLLILKCIKLIVHISIFHLSMTMMLLISLFNFCAFNLLPKKYMSN
ncbi:hypothetical protein CI610_03386 [invertebrate metagenome]|uniref:Uncharacterized protein n=1 Tax=invertebrate metagenome TaxID=1711999 RepID=A0A2H9T375_9ZZZZ